MDEKRRKKTKIESRREDPSRQKTKDTFDRSCKVNNKKDTNISSSFPITKIRNGTFDEILRYTPRVLLYPLPSEKFAISSKKNASSASNLNRSLITSIFDNSFVKKESECTEFAIISPTKKHGGKSFKNFMITSFFKPF